MHEIADSRSLNNLRRPMKSMVINTWKLLVGSSLLSLLLVNYSSAQTARAPSQQSAIPPASSDTQSDDSQHTPGSIEEEMRAKRAIKFAEEEHKETVDKAREVADLGSKLLSAYKFKSSLDKDDAKKLDRIEKLTKQLRSKVGGSDSDVTLDKPPSSLESAVHQVADASESLSCLVQKTPRQVVSAAVIDEANVLLQLVDLVRQFSGQ